MKLKKIDFALLRNMFRQSNQELKNNVELINDLNVFPVPDGDTGTNMSLTMESAVESLDSIEEKTIEEISKSVSKGSLMGARGNSGVILSQIFRGFAKGCESKKSLTAIEFSNALKDASDAAYSAVMKPVEGTILTVIRETSEKAIEFAEEDTLIDELIDYVTRIAKHSLDKTPEKLEALKQAGVVDAGGMGLLCILEGFKNAILGKELLEEEIKSISNKKDLKLDGVHTPEHIVFGYCTEFIVKGKIDGEKLKNKISDLGDSMVFVKNDDLVKVHVHTNNPGIALEYALEEGELIKVKIENMREQHNHVINTKNENEEDFNKKEDNKKYEIIAVAIGDGISDIFKDLGVSKIIKGGQTMNPSTKDLLEKIDETNAENIIILPNNSNIILAAEQAVKMTDKNVSIVPTKTIPQGINALVDFNPESSLKENVEVMSEVLDYVKTVEITFSVKDTTFDGVNIKKDSILGVSEGEIISVGENLHDIAYETLKKVIDSETEIVTIYYGEDSTEAEANELAKEIEELLDFGDVEVYYGGQPLYYYLMSVE